MWRNSRRWWGSCPRYAMASSNSPSIRRRGGEIASKSSNREIGAFVHPLGAGRRKAGQINAASCEMKWKSCNEACRVLTASVYSRGGASKAWGEAGGGLNEINESINLHHRTASLIIESEGINNEEKKINHIMYITDGRQSICKTPLGWNISNIFNHSITCAKAMLARRQARMWRGPDRDFEHGTGSEN